MDCCYMFNLFWVHSSVLSCIRVFIFKTTTSKDVLVYFVSTVTSVYNLRAGYRAEFWEPTWKMLWQGTQLNVIRVYILMPGHKMQGSSEKVKIQTKHFLYSITLILLRKYFIWFSSSIRRLRGPPSKERLVRTFGLFTNGLTLRDTKTRPSVNKYSSRVTEVFTGVSLTPIYSARYWLIRELTGLCSDRAWIVQVCCYLSQYESPNR
jgi:hypothetical protein